jgi:hypothetical protein
MSEFDFDELDRAVNGALGSSTDNVTFVATPATTTEPATSQSNEAPSVPAFVPAQRSTMTSAVPTPPSTPVTPPSVVPAPAVRRSSGRFMDMVHPSSDMRSSNSKNSVPAAAKAVAPANPQIARPVTSSQSLGSIFRSQPSEPLEQPVVEAPNDLSTSVWSEPLESPFLPDTKVEKRPLGGAEEPVSQGVSFDFQGLLDEPDELLLAASVAEKQIEANATPDGIDIVAAQTVDSEIEAKTYEEPVEEKETVLEPEVIIEVPEDTTPQPSLDEPVGPTSIIPQYKEQPSSQQPTGAMFDTESYHQAVVSPVKKRSGWFTVVLILILAILGAAGGWAVTTFVLPML